MSSLPLKTYLKTHTIGDIDLAQIGIAVSNTSHRLGKRAEPHPIASTDPPSPGLKHSCVSASQPATQFRHHECEKVCKACDSAESKFRM